MSNAGFGGFGTTEHKVKVDNTPEEYIASFYAVAHDRLAGKEPQIHRKRDIYAKQEEQDFLEQSGNEPSSNPLNQSTVKSEQSTDGNSQ